MFDRKYVVPLVIIVAVLIVAALGYKYYTTTAYYSLSQLNRAIKTHNSTIFARYMDMDKVAIAVSDKLMDDIDSNTSVGDFSSQMKVALIKGLIRDSHDAIATYLLKFFDEDVVHGDRPHDYKLKSMTKQGDYIRVAVLENTKTGKTAQIKLELNADSYWKVISLDLTELVEIGLLSQQPDLAAVLEKNKKESATN